jgi:dipeptidyl-peptidase-4
MSLFRFSAVFALSLASFSLAAQAPAKPLTVETIFAHGPLVGTPPSGLTWSPDGKHLTYLDGGELVDVNTASGKPQVLVSRAKLAALSGANATETDLDHRDRYNMANYV